jgi:hypothetical protein
MWGLNTTESGTSIWDKDLFTVLGLKKVDIIADNLPHYKLNEAFMAFGAVGLAYNVVTRCIHHLVRPFADSLYPMQLCKCLQTRKGGRSLRHYAYHPASTLPYFLRTQPSLDILSFI